MAHRADFDEWLLQSWVDITSRLHTVYHGYYIDMWSWMMAPLHSGRRQVAADNLVLRSPHAWVRSIGDIEDWSSVDRVTKSADPCKAPMDELLADPKMPSFIHYCQPGPYWNKYWLGDFGLYSARGALCQGAIRSSRLFH